MLRKSIDHRAMAAAAASTAATATATVPAAIVPKKTFAGIVDAEHWPLQVECAAFRNSDDKSHAIFILLVHWSKQLSWMTGRRFHEFDELHKQVCGAACTALHSFCLLCCICRVCGVSVSHSRDRFCLLAVCLPAHLNLMFSAMILSICLHWLWVCMHDFLLLTSLLVAR